MDSEPIVELNDVRVRYGSVEALRGVTLAIPPGATALVGRNGAGKSTLMKLLLGLIPASSGAGRVLEHRLGVAGARLRRAIGFMPESDAFVPGLTGHDHVALAGELCGLNRRQAGRRAHETLAYVDLGEARYRKVEQFSTGMKQRLKLAIALAHDPQLLLLDEPTVGLDPPGRRRMLELIRDVAQRHRKSLLLSTHLLADVEETCDHVAAIESGKAVAFGRIDDLAAGRPNCYRVGFEKVRDRAALTAALAREGAAGVIPADSPANLPEEDSATLRVSMPEKYDSRRFFHLAQELGIRVAAIEPEQEDLGDFYRRLIGRAGERKAS